MRRKARDLELTPEPLTEEQEQIDLIRQCEEEDNLKLYPLLKWIFHVPNGGWRAIKTALKMKMAGVKPGVPDLWLPVMRVLPDGRISGALIIELKRDTKDAKLSAYQTEWVRYLREAGYAVAVCKGARRALTILLWYLSLPAVPAVSVDMTTETERIPDGI